MSGTCIVWVTSVADSVADDSVGTVGTAIVWVGIVWVTMVGTGIVWVGIVWVTSVSVGGPAVSGSLDPEEMLATVSVGTLEEAASVIDATMPPVVSAGPLTEVASGACRLSRPGAAAAIGVSTVTHAGCSRPRTFGKTGTFLQLRYPRMNPVQLELSHCGLVLEAHRSS